ncbi:hypothetical protein BDW75DRAFT_224867 [Aspergillus navahoensis]
MKSNLALLTALTPRPPQNTQPHPSTPLTSPRHRHLSDRQYTLHIPIRIQSRNSNSHQDAVSKAQTARSPSPKTAV